MAKVINEKLEKKRIRCPHCGRLIEFTFEDIWASDVRGRENGDGWCDPDCIWCYINCPNCDKIIDVDDEISESDYKFLKKKYEHDWRSYYYDDEID